MEGTFCYKNFIAFSGVIEYNQPKMGDQGALCDANTLFGGNTE